MTYAPRAALPQRVLDRLDMKEALAHRDFGQVFAIARHWGGISFSAIAESCEMKPERVGVVARGHGKIESLDKILQICDGMRIPGNLLGLLPRPWESNSESVEKNGEQPHSFNVRRPLPTHPPDEMDPPLQEQETPWFSRRRISLSESALETVQAFRLADRQVGGGHLYAGVMRYLTSHVGPELVGDNSHAPFSAAAGLTEMAGWMAHDSGRDQLAARHFQRALQLVHAAGDPALTAQIWASRSHLALHHGQGDKALTAVERGWKILDGGEDIAVRGRILAMRARAQASLQQTVGCRRTLEAAEDLLAGRDEPAASQWTSPFDEGSLASEAARCMCDLSQFTAAVDYAHHALEVRTPDRTRARALAFLLQARALIGRGDVEHACALTRDVAQSSGPVSSLVVTDELARVVTALSPFETSHEIGATLPALRASVAQHRKMYHWLSTDDAGRT